MILDLIVIFFIALITFISYKRGLVKAAFSLIRVILAIFLVRFLYPFVGALLRERTPLYGSIKNRVTNTLGLEELILEQSAGGMLDSVAVGLNLPRFITDFILGETTEVYYSTNIALLEYHIAGNITRIILNIIAAIFVFVIVLIVMKLMEKVLNGFAELPVINKFNKLGGFVFGIITAFLYVFVVLIILTIFTRPEGAVYEVINNSRFTRFLNENNFLIYFLARILTP